MEMRTRIVAFGLLAAAAVAVGGCNGPEPPRGFVALFNGRNLDGWKGLVGNPETRPQMSKEQLAAEQAKADELMRKNWVVRDGELIYDGNGFDNLCTVKDYKDFELLIDWKVKPGADSGIYLRGSPQVQIWDPGSRKIGSGGLFNNKENPDKPLKMADLPVGQWNRFRIVMIGRWVVVYLNDVLVVDTTVLENYWDRSKDIYESGPIELQAHNSRVYFKNIFIREIE
jgi:hypothetical protein